MQIFLQQLWQAFWSALFPPRCLVCGTLNIIPLPGRFPDQGILPGDAAACLCLPCRRGFSPIVRPFCTTCGLPFVGKEGKNHTCGDCLAQERHFMKARAFGVYEGSLLEAIHLLKYRKKLSLVRPLSALVKKTFDACWGGGSVDLLVPVPLHITRLRQRGFNQSYLLFRQWARAQAIPMDGLALRRRRRTDPQTGLNRKQRLSNIKGAFSVPKPDTVKDKRVVLVDDVFTTGATANACAKALMEAGAAGVDVLTLARAV